MESKIKRTIAILLTLCFFVSITAIPGSALTTKSGENFNPGIWTQAQIDQYNTARNNALIQGENDGRIEGEQDGYDDCKKGINDPNPPRQKKPQTSSNPTQAGWIDGYNDGFYKGYMSNSGYKAGCQRAQRDLGVSSSSSSSNSKCKLSDKPNCRQGKEAVCILYSDGSIGWKCVRK